MLQDVWIGWLELDLLLGDVHTLKEKRSVVRPIVAELQRRFAVSAAEVGDQDLHRRATVGVALGPVPPSTVSYRVRSQWLQIKSPVRSA